MMLMRRRLGCRSREMEMRIDFDEQDSRSGVTATICVRDCRLGSDTRVVGAVCIFAGALSVDLTWYHGEVEESVWTGVDLLSRLFKSLEIPLSYFFPDLGFRPRELGRVESRCDFFPANLHCWVSFEWLLLGLCLMAGFRSRFLGFGHIHFALGRSYYWFSDVGACEEPLFSVLSPEFSWFLWQ
ncbi:hypothetical protein HID58_029168, partial [Brassica napus]